MQNPENNIIVIMTHKEVTRLYKTFLESLEDLKNEHPEILPPEKYEQLRKRVLDNGNECIRSMVSFLDYFNFTIDAKKVEEAAAQKRIVKKFITCAPIMIK